jgi:hypothetical protein
MSPSLFFSNTSSTFSKTPCSMWASFLDSMIFFVIVYVSLKFKTGFLLQAGRPSILWTIVQDSTVYFLIIFSSHLLSLIMLLVTRVSSTTPMVIWTTSDQLTQPSLQFLPALWVLSHTYTNEWPETPLNDPQQEPHVRSHLHSPSLTHAHKVWNRLLPLMVSRLMLLLKKASSTKGIGWMSDGLLRMHVRTITQMESEHPSNSPEDGSGTTSSDVALFDLSDRQVRGRSGEGTV